MTNENVDLIRSAYAAYARGDLNSMLELIDPDLEWTFLDPSAANPPPQVCHGRGELEGALRAQIDHGLHAELEEVEGSGDHVMVVVRIPGRDARRGRAGDDRAYNVFTVRSGRVVALRACRDRREARAVAGLADT